MATVKASERTVWHREATFVLRNLLYARRVSYKQLSRQLQALGVDVPAKTLSSKINRGSFSFLFFLQCMHAIGVSDVRFTLDELTPAELATLQRAKRATGRIPPQLKRKKQHA